MSNNPDPVATSIVPPPCPAPISAAGGVIEKEQSAPGSSPTLETPPAAVDVLAPGPLVDGPLLDGRTHSRLVPLPVGLTDQGGCPSNVRR